MDIIIGQIYRHFKGNLYKTLMLAENSETGEEMVVYQALYGENRVYVRPKDMFVEVLDRTKYPEAKQTYRFELWTDAGPAKETASSSVISKGDSPSGSDDAQAAGDSTVSAAGPAEGEKQQRLYWQDPRQQDTNPIRVASEVTGPASKSLEETAAGPEPAGSESSGMDPQLEDFLDTKDFSEKLRILQEMKNSVTDAAIDTMAFSLDLELHEGSTEERYKELLGCVMLRERFENSRLRN